MLRILRRRQRSRSNDCWGLRSTALTPGRAFGGNLKLPTGTPTEGAIQRTCEALRYRMAEPDAGLIFFVVRAKLITREARLGGGRHLYFALTSPLDPNG